MPTGDPPIHRCNCCYQQTYGTTFQVGPVIWGSEEARRIVRYPEAVRLLRRSQTAFNKADDDISAFLASEPTP